MSALCSVPACKLFRATWTGGVGPRRGNRAFTLVEAVISTVIVAVMFVAALNTVGASAVTQYKAALLSRGRLSAESLMSEILCRSYQDPEGAPVFGREAGESASTRTAFDDVDDYHGWSADPPTARDGTPLPNSTGWQRTVTVEWVNSTNPQQTETTETGVKRITVTATCNGIPQASLVALKAAGQ